MPGFGEQTASVEHVSEQHAFLRHTVERRVSRSDRQDARVRIPPVVGEKEEMFGLRVARTHWRVGARAFRGWKIKSAKPAMTDSRPDLLS